MVRLDDTSSPAGFLNSLYALPSNPVTVRIELKQKLSSFYMSTLSTKESDLETLKGACRIFTFVKILPGTYKKKNGRP
jgi:hypothetical protein